MTIRRSLPFSRFWSGATRAGSVLEGSAAAGELLLDGLPSCGPRKLWNWQGVSRPMRKPSVRRTRQFAVDVIRICLRSTRRRRYHNRSLLDRSSLVSAGERVRKAEELKEVADREFREGSNPKDRPWTFARTLGPRLRRLKRWSNSERRTTPATRLLRPFSAVVNASQDVHRCRAARKWEVHSLPGGGLAGTGACPFGIGGRAIQ